MVVDPVVDAELLEVAELLELALELDPLELQAAMIIIAATAAAVADTALRVPVP